MIVGHFMEIKKGLEREEKLGNQTCPRTLKLRRIDKTNLIDLFL